MEESGSEKNSSEEESLTSIELGFGNNKWIVLLSLCLALVVNGSSYSYYISLTTIFLKTYEIPLFVIQMAYAMDPFCYIPATYIIGDYLLRNLSKYACLFTSIIGLLICVWIRALVNFSFAFVFISNIFKGLSSPLIMNIISKTSNDWFPQNQRILATVICIVCMNIGNALGFIISPMVIGDYSDPYETQIKIRKSTIIYAEISSLLFFISLILYRNDPDNLNLSHDDSEGKNENIRENVSTLIKNGNFMKLYFFVVVPIILSNTSGSLLGALYIPFGFDPKQSGVLGAVVIGCGVFSAFVISIIVGETKKYRLFSILLNFVQVISYLSIILCAPLNKLGLLLICGGLLGASGAPLYAFGLEYGNELGFPVGQASISGFILSSASFLTFVFVSVSGVIMGEGTKAGSYIYHAICICILIICTFLSFITEEKLNRMESENIKAIIDTEKEF